MSHDTGSPYSIEARAYGADLLQRGAPGGWDDYNYVPSCHIQLVTPDFARAKLEEWHYDLQRPLSKENVKRLCVEHLAGRFVPGTPVFVCEPPSRNKYQVNGRHTFNMVIDTDKACALTVVNLRVPNFDAVGLVYGRFDIHKTRSYADSLKAALGETPSAMAKKVLTGIPHILGGFSATAAGRQGRDDRIQLTINDYIKEGVVDRLYASLHGDGSRSNVLKRVNRAGVIAIAAYTTKHQASFAHEFWGFVASESHPDVSHGSRVLANYLKENSSAGSRQQQEDMYQAAKAWNSAFEEKKVGYFKTSNWHDNHQQFYIAGTPWRKGNPNG